MARGRKITLHLVEGNASGIIKAQLGNWVGLVTQAPRTRIDDLAKDNDVKRPGVYILLGPATENRPGESTVYIGESENIIQRLGQHEKDDEKAQFEQMTVVTSTDENLTKAHIRYLESRLINTAHETKLYNVQNGTRPEAPPLPSADIDEMEVFLENLQLLLPALGVNLTQSSEEKSQDQLTNLTSASNASPIFMMSTSEQGSSVSVKATARRLGSKFVVEKGSTALIRDDSRSYTDLKRRLIN